MRNEIPKWGWYNGRFLFDYADALESEKIQDIRDFYESFKRKRLNGIDFPIKNQGLAISLLYMLLVVPREMWENKEHVGTQFTFNTRNCFTFKIGAELTLWHFLKRMRHSVAHANFDINREGQYTFWNKNNGRINFKVTICHSDLFEFITEIGKYYINQIGTQQITQANR